MAGTFSTAPPPGPPPKPTTRLRLEHPAITAHLSAMTVDHGGPDLYASKVSKLGPDPLRDDADAELLWASLARCRKPIGLVLMDQSMMAGEGC